MMRPTILNVLVLLSTFYYAAGQKLPTQTKLKSNATKNATAIVGRCAVVVRPDDKKIKLLKKGISEDEYMTLVSDNQYYLGTATAFLDSARVKQLEKLAHGTLVFKSASGQYFKVQLVNFQWGIILFNGRAKPIEADVTDIESSYRAYMKK